MTAQPVLPKPANSLLILLLPPLLLALLAGACAGPPAGTGVRTRGYAFLTPPEVTFDLAQGRAITPRRLAGRLKRTRLLFLGEHHAEPRSHAFQQEIIEKLLRDGRKLTVALEMFPPSANQALEGWRTGKLNELEFLERSGWYESWAFPWSYYRGLFTLLRRHRVPLRGVNAEKSTRAAVRKGDLSALTPALREEIGDPGASPEPHGAYLLDALRSVGHGGDLDERAPRFQAYRRVQVLWDRLIGLRAARLAEGAGARGIVVVLIGSGHLAHGLGANLQAARASTVAQLSIWDNVVEKRPGRRYPVPVGMAGLARIYEREPGRRGYPSLLGLKLERDPAGVKVKAVRLPEDSPLHALKAGDVITALAGKPVATPAALRLAYEGLSFGDSAALTLSRNGKQITLKLPVGAPGEH